MLALPSTSGSLRSVPCQGHVRAMSAPCQYRVSAVSVPCRCPVSPVSVSCQYRVCIKISFTFVARVHVIDFRTQTWGQRYRNTCHQTTSCSVCDFRSQTGENATKKCTIKHVMFYLRFQNTGLGTTLQKHMPSEQLIFCVISEHRLSDNATEMPAIKYLMFYV